jgi:hypothetical protein
MSKRLSEIEIKKRLTRLTNLERLYTDQTVTVRKLRAENKQLKLQITDITAKFEHIMETQAARITELETMVFGRKKQPRSGNDNNNDNNNQSIPKPPRNASSFRRDLPPEDEITNEEHYSIDICKHCGSQLVDKKVCVRYVQDIILAALNPDTNFKTCIRQTVERGWCVHCGKYSSAKDLRGQDVSLGPVVRALVCYLVTLRDHSYDQVANILWDLYRFKLTDGEITTIMNDQRLKLLPEYEKLQNGIRASPAAHFDESRYSIQSEQGAGYAWSMSSTTSSDVVFKLADSRGKGNAKALVGENYQGIGITDRYAGYKHLFENKDGSSRHQICWAHLQRNAKDLTHLECLTKAKQTHVNTYYKKLASIYADIRKYQAEPFELDTRQRQADQLLKRVKLLCIPHKLDPQKLVSLKSGILEYQDSLFLCLTTDGIPADNNRAERDIRKLVIKRKKSLGVKTPKGARTLEVLLSVCWSLYNRDRDNFFPNYRGLIGD